MGVLKGNKGWIIYRFWGDLGMEGFEDLKGIFGGWDWS